jgi:hypothetical protein
MSVITTGQFTIVDQNDAKPIMAFISANGSVQQTYNKDNAIESFTPNWVNTPLTLTAAVYVGGINVIDGSSITNRKWSTTFDGTSIGSTKSFVRNTNFASTDTSQTYFFTCTYTDPTTNIPSRVDSQITLSILKTGTNAVYVLTSGIDVIAQSDTATKNVAVIKAELIRSSGADTSGLQYKWYSISSSGVATQLWSGVAGVANYGLKTTATGAAPTATAANLGAATFTTAGVTSSTAYTSVVAGQVGYNTLVVSENAVTNFQLFRVDVYDSADNASLVYTAYFTISDVSDPYTITITSSNGDRLLNGLGNTTLTAKVYSGSQEISSYTGWVFDWYFRNSVGTRVGFVSSSSPPTPDITRTISSNTTGSVTLSTAVTLAAGDLVKLVSADGSIVKFAQVTATTSTLVTLQAATGDNINVGAVSTITASEFVGGTLYKAISKKTATTTNTLTVTQFDVDAKATIQVDATRP